MKAQTACRAILVVGILLAASVHATAQTCVPAPAGIVGWWPGNGSANDVIAGNDGQLAGGATFADAVVQLGFEFDGDGGHVEIPTSAALQPAHVSVEAWVRFDALDTPIVSEFGAPGLQYVVFKKNTRTFNFEAYALRKERRDGVDRFAFSVADVNGFGGDRVAYSETVVTVGEFYHVVGTYDGAAVRLYVNGVLEGEAPVSLTIDYGSRPLFIGTSGETVFDGRLDGIVDEASVYNRALTGAETAALHAAGSSGKCASAAGLLTSLVNFVQTLNVSRGIANSLDVKLQNALEALDAAGAGDMVSACGAMAAFLNEARAQSGQALTEAQAAQLIGLAEQVRVALGCRS